MGTESLASGGGFGSDRVMVFPLLFAPFVPVDLVERCRAVGLVVAPVLKVSNGGDRGCIVSVSGAESIALIFGECWGCKWPVELG